MSTESVTLQGQDGPVTGEDHPWADDDEPNDQDEPPEGEGPEAQETPEIRIPIDPAIFESLIPFQDLQRTIAAMDFSGIRAAQQAAEVFASQLPDLTALQDTVQAHIAQSVDFSAIASIQRNFANLALPQIVDKAEVGEGYRPVPQSARAAAGQRSARRDQFPWPCGRAAPLPRRWPPTARTG